MRTTWKWVSVATIALVATTAMAQGRGNGRDKDQERGRDNASVEVQASIHFSVDQRQAVSVYLGDQRKARANCPPGLAKKNNGCQPPGQAKRYTLGQPLPRDIVIGPVPDQISVRIGLPPVGYVYGMVDGDLVKLVAGTLLVVDAIDGL